MQSSGVNRLQGLAMSLYVQHIHILDEDQASGIQNTLASLQ